MSKVKLILTDIDGTLVVNGQHTVSERVRDAVIAAENADVAVAPVTGRPYEMAQGVMNVLGFDGLCVLDGGASIRKVTTGELVWSKWLGPDVLKRIVGITAPHCVLIDYDVGQVERSPDDVDIDLITERAPYVFAIVHKQAAAGIMAKLDRIPNIHPHLLVDRKDQPGLQEIQVTHREGNKRHGVHELLRILGVGKDEVMAVGDGNNDLPLFESAALRAMPRTGLRPQPTSS